MVFQIQKFKIAELIFISTENTNISKDNIQEIKNRFTSIIDSFQNEYDKNYNAGFIKGDKSSLPYNASTYISDKNNQLVLHFTNSYNNPLMIIFDLKNKKVCNYIDIEQAKSILNDFTFEDIMEQLYTPVYLNNRYKNIPNFNQFVEYYEKELLKHTNKNTITGYDCFELSLE